MNTYLSQKGLRTLEQAAGSFNISSRTLRRWLRWYREGGEGNLVRVKRGYKSEFDIEMGKKVVRLKEKSPWLTLADARQILRKERIEVSTRRIWAIWKRFGLAGFIKGKFSLNYADYVIPTKETSLGLKAVANLLKKGEIREAASILNSLPSCPKNPLLEKIPNRLLSLPRRVEKLYLLFGKVTFRELRKKAKSLREKAENKGLLYLSVRAGIMECLALDWLQEAETLFTLVNRLKSHLMSKGSGKLGGDPSLRLSLSLLEGLALAKLMRIKDALQCIRNCYIVIRSFPSSLEAKYNLVSLFISIHHFREATGLYDQFDLKQDPEKQIIAASLRAIAGKYRTALSTLKSIEPKLNKHLKNKLVQVRAICFLGQGKISQATRSLQLATEFAKKETLRYDFHTGTLLLAACYAANRDNFNAKILIKRFIPILKKLGTRRDLIMRYIILGENLKIDEENLTPPLRLALFLNKAQKSLRIKDYRKAYKYAISKGIVSHLHVLLLFFPESIKRLMVKGKYIRLPKALLNLPVFKSEIPVYHLKFLGTFKIYRNGQLIRSHISPKEIAFLIHLALRGRTIPLSKIYNNFWSESKSPERTFSHFLVSIRKHLRLSTRDLYISSARGKSLFFNIHILTDYQTYQETILRAKMLDRAGEWGFAKKEYLQAFALFRDEPFIKIYDPWSDNMRIVILNKLEAEAIHFVKSCLTHKNKADAKKVLERVTKIIPQSTEIENMVKGLNS